MIISIDGYDGTGKTSLAEKLAEKYNFFYMEKPAIYMIKKYESCTTQQAAVRLKEIEHELFSAGNKQNIAKFYCSVLAWLSSYSKKFNIILDRGFLTTYAVIGFPETESIFDYYLNEGAFLDGSIYLKAKDETRVQRIYKKNPNDPDLKFPVKWHENNLEEYANSKKVNYIIIDTDNLTKEEVFNKAISIFDNFLKCKTTNNDDEPLQNK